MAGATEPVHKKPAAIWLPVVSDFSVSDLVAFVGHLTVRNHLVVNAVSVAYNAIPASRNQARQIPTAGYQPVPIIGRVRRDHNCPIGADRNLSPTVERRLNSLPQIAR